MLWRATLQFGLLKALLASTNRVASESLVPATYFVTMDMPMHIESVAPLQDCSTGCTGSISRELIYSLRAVGHTHARAHMQSQTDIVDKSNFKKPPWV